MSTNFVSNSDHLLSDHKEEMKDDASMKQTKNDVDKKPDGSGLAASLSTEIELACTGSKDYGKNEVLKMRSSSGGEKIEIVLMDRNGHGDGAGVTKNRKNDDEAQSQNKKKDSNSMDNPGINYNTTMPFYSDRKDHAFVVHLANLHKKEEEDDDDESNTLTNINKKSIVVDLTHGLKGKEKISKTKWRPLGVFILYFVLALPSYYTNNYVYMMPSLIFSFLLIIFCYLFTDWNVSKLVAHNLVKESEEKEEKLREKIAFDLSMLSMKTQETQETQHNRFGMKKRQRNKFKNGIESGIDSPFSLSNSNENSNNLNDLNLNSNSNVIVINNKHIIGNENRGIPFNKFKYDAETFDDFASYLFNINNIDKGDLLNNNKGGVVPRKVQWFILFGGFFTFLILFFTMYHSYDDGDSTPWTKRCIVNEYLSDKYVNNGNCLVKHGASSAVWSFCSYAAFVALFVMRSPTTESQKLKDIVEGIIKCRFPQKAKHKMDAIEVASHEATKRFVDYCRNTNAEHKPVGIPWVVLLATTFCLAESLAAVFVSDRTMFWDIETNKLLSYAIYGASRTIAAFYVYRGLAEYWVVNHMFIRDFVAMTSLGGAMYFSDSSDVICWYSMRSFYTDYQQPIMSGGRGSPPFAAMLIGCTIIGIFIITQFLWGNGLAYLYRDPDGVMVMMMVFLALVFMCRFIWASVSTYRMQLNHIEALKHELLRLELLRDAWDEENKLIKDGSVIVNVTVNNLNEMKIEEFRESIKDTLQDVKNPFNQTISAVKYVAKYLKAHDVAPRILGIPMTNAVLFTGIGYTVTIAGGIIGLVFG